MLTVKAVMIQVCQEKSNTSKHEYPNIPEDADDETSDNVNLSLLEQERVKMKKNQDTRRFKCF